MIDNPKIADLIVNAVADAEKANARISKSVSKGRKSKNDVMCERTNTAARLLRELKDKISDVCKTEGQRWNQAEWDNIDETIVNAIGLRYAPYLYHPVDLGFDEMSEGLYCLRNRIKGLDALVSHPSPIGERFKLTIVLENGEEMVDRDFSFVVNRIEAGKDQWTGYTCYDGTGQFVGYYHSSIINVIEMDGDIRSVAYVDIGKNPDDPIWKRQKSEIREGKDWVMAEDFPPVWMGTLR